jgi:glycosyltransferase involved in cell wall biosynthesis
VKKLLVSCDDYTFYFDGKYYLREFGYTLTTRYLSVFDCIRLAIRTKLVISEPELGAYNIPITDERIEIFPIPFFQGPSQFIQNYIKIVRAVRKSHEGCDAAIFRIPSAIGFSVLSAARKHGIPYAVEVVANPLEATDNKNIVVRMLKQNMNYKQLHACRHADGASYVTQYALQKLYPANKPGHFESYYSSVQLSNSYFSGARAYPKHKPFIICHVANPIKTFMKGHIVVIDVIKQLSEKGYDIKAQFAGEGEFVPLFEKYSDKLGIADKISFVGLLEQRKLKEFLEKSDLMVFPSKSEGLPRVIIEAMASGLPCLSSSVGGIPELITDELMFDPDDSAGFAHKVAELIDNPDMYINLSKAAFEKAQEYSADLLQVRRIEFYQKLKSIC